MGNDVMKVIKNRRSIRKFTDAPVSRDDLERILQAGICAPSAKNRQPWKYYVYTGGAKQELLTCMERGLERERGENKLLPDSCFGLPDAFHTLQIMREAPVLIMIENTNGSSPFQNINTDHRVTEICDSLSIGASVENMLLAAEVLGYGTLWIANTCFAYTELTSCMKLSGQLVGAIALGRPNEAPGPRPRKSLSEVVEFRS